MSFVWEYKITSQQLMDETSPQERELLRSLLTDSILHYLRFQCPVYLERFGLVIPQLTEKTCSQPLIDDEHPEESQCTVLRREKYVTVHFEKCGELVTYHHEKYNGIIETAALAEYVFLRLPISLQLKWADKGTRRLVRGIVRSIRDEVIVDGFSSQLRPVGDFLSLHNRQGETVNDWYAGADIFIVPAYSFPVEAEILSQYEPPVLDSAWELFEAALGAPLREYKLELGQILKDLGFDSAEFERHVHSNHQTLHCATFCCKDQKSENDCLLFVTDGLRSLCTLDRQEIGTELVVQVRISPEEMSTYQSDNASIGLEEFAKRLLTGGWILLQSAPSKTLKEGKGLHIGQELSRIDNIQQIPSSITSVFSIPLRLATLPQKSEERPFRYMNVIGITEDELRFGETRSPEHLITLLQSRNYDQVSSPTRRSLFQSSARKRKTSQSGTRNTLPESEKAAPVRR